MTTRYFNKNKRGDNPLNDQEQTQTEPWQLGCSPDRSKPWRRKETPSAMPHARTFSKGRSG